jgi:hypothetical protein
VSAIDSIFAYIAKQEGWDSPDPTVVPRRLDNPGDLEFAGQMGATPIKVGNHVFAKFPTAWQGIVAGYRQLYADIAKGWTLRQVIMSWAPPSENNSEAYLQGVATGCGISADTPLYSYVVTAFALALKS